MSERDARPIAIALVPRHGRWLVAKRLDGAHLGGLWEFPGGKCEAGESASDAAIRELREECGVEARAVRSLIPVRFAYPDRELTMTPVLCAWIAGEPRPLGSQECRWVTLEELRGLPMPPANHAILRVLAAVEAPLNPDRGPA